VLARFAEGGAGLVLTWYAFALAALALTPLAIGLAMTPRRLADDPAMTASAAIIGALAGLTQAIGLMRWVFVVPDLARVAASGDPAGEAAAAHDFALIHAYGGVAIGEHLGQLLTAPFVALLAIIQWREDQRIAATLGLLTAPLLALGTGEGLMLALGRDGDALPPARIRDIFIGWVTSFSVPSLAKWPCEGRLSTTSPTGSTSDSLPRGIGAD
jgi:hypothetical protein